MHTDKTLKDGMQESSIKKIVFGNLIVAAAYIALGLIGQTLAIPPGNVTPVWPPSGLALAAILLRGDRMWPGIWLGAFIVNFQGFATSASTLPLSILFIVACAIGVGSVLQPLFGALAVRRFAGGANFFQKLPHTIRFICLVPVMCLISSTIGVISLGLGGVSSGVNLSELWLTWWLGDAVGVFLLTPLLLAWGSKGEGRHSIETTLEFVILTIAIAVSGVIAFQGVLPTTNLPLAYLPVPFILWSAYRLNEKEALVGLLILAGISAWGTSRGFGPFSLASVNTSLLALQTYMIFIASMAFLVVSASSERKQLEELLRVAHDELEQKVRDRTEKLRKEVAAREKSEGQLQFVINNIPVLIAYVGADQRYQLVNETCAQWYGIQKEEVVGKSITDIHGPNVGEFRDHIEKALSTGTETFELTTTYPDGVTRDVVLSYIAISDSFGDGLSYLAVGVDLSELKRAEAQLIQTAKLASLGEMATGTAHEINQPLNIIRMTTDTLIEMLAEGEALTPNFLKTKLERITSQIERATNIIDRMRIFGRNPAEYATEVSPQDAVMGAVSHLSEQLRLDEIELELDIPETCRHVMGDLVKIEQVILNLLTNAHDAIMDKAERITAGEGPKRITLTMEDDPAANVIKVIVKDTGGGIPQDALSKLFDPFFTTKEIGKGTGVGLSISYGIVTEMGGAITAENVDGGAMFTVTLPAVDEEPGQA